MPQIANDETAALIDRLHDLIKNAEPSLRELAESTHHLSPPERLHHSTLSNILNHRPDRNLYLQQLLVLLKLLRVPLDEFVIGQRPAQVARAFSRLEPSEQRAIAASLADLLENRQGSKGLARKLRSG